MAQRKVISSNKVANAITSWDTDDELSSDEGDAEKQLGSSFSSSARPAFIASNSSEDKSDHDSNDVTSTGRQEATSSDITGKNGLLWTSSQSALTRRTATHNVFTPSPGVPRSVLCTITTPYDAWKMFIYESILRSITKFTTDEAVRCGDVDFSLTLDELESFIALQYARGVYGKNHLVAFLWSKNYGIPIFGQTMPRNKFTKIMKYLHFDYKPNRIKRGPGADKFAPIRDVFTTFISMCKSKYTYDFSLTVDEQLMPLKSRCSFITFMPNKLDKYGIKFWVLVDVKAKYVANITPYLGAQEKEGCCGVPLGESVVIKITIL